MGNVAKIVAGVPAGVLIWILALSQAIFVTQGVEVSPNPNPRDLLETVAKARQQISSGEMELEWSIYWFERPLDGTNHINLKVVFDGTRRRFESVGREYAYTLMGPGAAEVSDAKGAELGLAREARVRAGLSEPFEARSVTSYDGSVLLRYRETDGNPERVTMRDPGVSTAGTTIFDPRCLGLRTYLLIDATIESCLRHKDANSIELLGKESIDGVAAWHVRVKSKYDESLDFWVEAAHSQHLLKHAWGADTVVSKFDEKNPQDAIPVEVRVSEYRNGKQLMELRFVRTKARFNVPVDPASWTMAGLGMPVGTSVSDDRISRHIGYWDGKQVSKDFPGNAPRRKPRERANPAKLLALVEQDPRSAFGLLAATWVILNTTNGPMVEKAANIIQREHAQSTNLVYLCQNLARAPRNNTPEMLKTILNSNTSREVQAHACLALANQLKHTANETGDRHAAAESGRLYERILRQYADVSSEGTGLAEQAKAELDAPRVGTAAPEIEGMDIQGVKFKLSDYRGKVVVLDFWGDW